MRTLITTVLIITAFTQLYAQKSTLMEQQFIELETKWMNAWKAKDEAALRKIVADEFTLTSSLSSGELTNKEQWIEKAMRFF